MKDTNAYSFTTDIPIELFNYSKYGRNWRSIYISVQYYYCLHVYMLEYQLNFSSFMKILQLK